MSEYEELLHAMQSGVAMKMERDGAETSPKHLRVGVNAAMCDHAGLVRLLISKGVITAEEYLAAITEEMRAEVRRYEETLSRIFATRITLG